MYNSYHIAINEYVYGSDLSGGIDFSVVAFQIQGTTRGQIILYIDNGLSWIRIGISYIISAKKDLFVGTVVASGFQFQQKNSNNVY